MQTQAIDDPALDDDVTAYRERARERLAQIAEQTKQVLTEHGIDTSVFFLIPTQRRLPYITFGTYHSIPMTTNGTVSLRSSASIVRQTVGLDRHTMPRSRLRNHRRLGATVCCRRSHDPMKYRNIATDRFQLPSTHPILATLPY